MRRALLALLLAALLTTAGCSGAFGGDATGTDATTGATTTDAPADETSGGTTEATPTASDRLPPGVTGDGLADANALVSAHADALDGRSVTFRERTARRYGNGTLASRTNMTVRTAGNRTRFLVEYESADEPVYGDSEGRVVTFSDGQGLYRSVETPNSSWTTVLRGPNGDRRDPEFLGLHADRSDDLRVLLTAFALNGSEHVKRLADDPRRYRLRSSEVAHPELLASLLDLNAVQNASLSLVATSEGRVVEYRVEYAGTKPGREISGTRTLEYWAVGETTVQTPAWFDRVKEQTEENATSTTGE